VGRLGVGFAGPYEFLAHSVREGMHQAELRDLFVRLGLADVRYYELAGGIAAVHVGTRPRPS
jgi:demethylmenaquinone methyltransferase/2-methoxy-6-polyprenyl-1,4-benzoquinol methylase